MTGVKTQEKPEALLNLKTIVVAVDLSRHSEATALFAASVARRFGAKLRVVHVFSPSPAAEFGRAADHPSLKDNQQEAEKHLSALTAKVRAFYPRTAYILRVGDPCEQIIQAAAVAGADMIVTARHEQTVIGRLLNLSEAPKIIHQANCPVLVWQDHHHPS
jgi:nucleotide-binding universal stress UspA family protein